MDDTNKYFLVTRRAQNRQNLEELLDLARSRSSAERTIAASGLGEYGGRNVFLPLLHLIFDEDFVVQCEAVLNLGVSNDSRAYFVLANVYRHAEELTTERPEELRIRVLQAFSANCDPRAYELLTDAENRPLLSGLARFVKEKVKRKRRQFVYTYHGSDEDREAACKTPGRVMVFSPQSVEQIYPILETFRRDWEQKKLIELPQSYVVDSRERIYFGGYLLEHVQVAQGMNVLAAGEAYFDKDDYGWYIRELNNQSNGYYPHENTIELVRRVFARSGIRFPYTFSQTYSINGWLNEDILSVYWSSIAQQKGS